MRTRTSCTCFKLSNLPVTKHPGHCSYILQTRITSHHAAIPLSSLSSSFSLSYLLGKWSSITCRGAEGGTGDFAMQMPGNYPKARRVVAHRWKQSRQRVREEERQRERKTWTKHWFHMPVDAGWLGCFESVWGCRRRKGEMEGGDEKVMRVTYMHTKIPRCVLVSSTCMCLYAFLLQMINKFNIFLTLLYPMMEEGSSFNSEEWQSKIKPFFFAWVQQ